MTISLIFLEKRLTHERKFSHFFTPVKSRELPQRGREGDREMKNGEASLLRYSLDCNVTSYIKSCACVCVSVCVCYGCMQMSGICCSAFLMSLRWPDRDRDREIERQIVATRTEQRLPAA